MSVRNNSLAKKLRVDTMLVEKAVHRLPENYSIKDLSRATGLSTSRCYRCWVRLAKKGIVSKVKAV